MQHTLKISVTPRRSAYSIKVGFGLLEKAGSWARKALGKQAERIAIISDENVFGYYGQPVTNSLITAGFAPFTHFVRGGERRKDLKAVEQILDFLSENGITRTDAVLAIGGGVVGDIAGFAAAVHLRGVRCLNVPTTLLAMLDSSVGGKTGVNSKFGKNLIGAFHQPAGVLIDPSTLTTLPGRELTAGFCEAIKQGAVSGRRLLDSTADILAAFPEGRFADWLEKSRSRSQISYLIAAHIAFKADIVAGDERESSKRTDARSRKILNFGHTLAHALEKVTGYKYLRHGEAVGYGILFAAELSKSLALCSEKDVKLLNDVVHRAGILPSLADIDEKEVFEAFKFDKKHAAGSLQMVLLKGIGRPVIVADNDIPKKTVQKVLKRLINESSRT
jgi:3-dehydroquinate synthase